EGDKVIFSVSANGFLYNMVRIMAGTLYEVAIGKIKKESIDSLFCMSDV
ncbi:MAG: tRNA pseudouridine(38-40) synthase TruA, partial [Anaerotignum sp.]|nr:tRNA pseudouridine(38-40) synthase TruA [Anaerotignum sp.]